MKLWNCFLNHYSYFHREVKCRSKPEVFAIEFTNYCNLNCAICHRRKMERKVEYVDFSLFKKIIDEVKRCNRYIWLHNFGKPLFHSNLVYMINYCNNNSVEEGNIIFKLN